MPSRDQIDLLVAALDAIDTSSLARKLRAAVRRDATASARRDGFPRGGPGGGDTTIKWCFEHDSGDCACAVSIDAPNDPTGDAASGPDLHDPLHDDVTAAITNLDIAVHNLHALAARLTKIDSQQVLAERNAPPGCAVMARVGVFEPVYRRIPTQPGGDPVPLGLWAYKFFHNNNRLPVDTEAEQHALGNNVHGRKTVITDDTTGLDRVRDRRRKRMRLDG